MDYSELKNLVKKLSHEYYDLAHPSVSDEEWDALYDQLHTIESRQGWKDSDSPTLRVGGEAGKVRHPFKLYSLQKSYDSTEIGSEFNVRVPKLDGTNLSLIYREGKLDLALTRGNGEYGENVTHLMKHCAGVPQKISIDSAVIVGECVTDNTVDNFRNYVSGALGLKSADEFSERSIRFIAHDYLGVRTDYRARMSIVKNAGFNIIFEEDLCGQYPQDGVVYRIDSWSECDRLGYTSKYPRFAIALKERGALLAVTRLQSVDWVVGRTGAVNPVGHVDPVEIDGALISRVTLHNIEFIESHKLGVGDLIQIERSGGVIPKFISVLEAHPSSQTIDKLHAEQAIGCTLRRQGPKLFCDDDSKLSTVKLLEHYIRIMEIKGVGPASIKKMGLTHPVDLYTPQPWHILGANGSKIQDELDRSKTKPYSQVLASLGIPGVGRSMSRDIVSILPQFSQLREIEYQTIAGVGPKTVENILTWLEVNEEWVETLPVQLKQDLSIERVLDTSSNKKVCVTGKLDMTRNQISEHLAQFGYQVTNTVTKDCVALISGDDNTTSSKAKRAESLGIKIINYWNNRAEILKGIV